MTDYEKTSLLLLSTILGGIAQLVDLAPEGPKSTAIQEWFAKVVEMQTLVNKLVEKAPRTDGN